jgi:3-deoxy-manno-octulosonate cytidylyltransferase (CMP-KDO synthetase)
MLGFAVPVVLPSELAPFIRSARTVAIIPARRGSTRLPGKPLATIAGRPMIEHVYRRATEARTVDAVIVATDAEEIAEVVSAFGGTAVMTSAAHPTGTDRLAEVAAHLSGDIVVNVQGDLPFLPPQPIDAAVNLLREDPALPMATLRRAIADPHEVTNPSVVKVVVGNDGRALYFSRAAIPFVRPGQPAPQIWKHFGLYVYRRPFLLTLAGLPPTPLERAESLEQLRVLEHGFSIGTIETTMDTVEVDTPDDLERARRLTESTVPD